MQLVTFMYLILQIVVMVVESLPSIDRVCNPQNNHLPYDGYRGEIRIKGPSDFKFHLYMCKDSRLIQDIEVEMSNGPLNIPWAKNLTGSIINSETSHVSFVLARRKKYALRNFPIFLPETAIGLLYKSDDSTLPIISEDLIKGHWFEYLQLQIVLHIPIFYTPDLTSNRHPNNHDPKMFDSLGGELHSSFPFKILKDEGYQYGKDIDIDQLNAKVQSYLQNTLKLKKFSGIEFFKSLTGWGSYTKILRRVENIYNLMEP